MRPVVAFWIFMNKMVAFEPLNKSLPLSLLHKIHFYDVCTTFFAYKRTFILFLLDMNM